MWVDPFWLGFSVGVIVGVVTLFIIASIYNRRNK